MSRTAQVFLVLAGILLTAALTITYAPAPPAAGVPDIRPLWGIGILALVASIVVDWRLVRRWLARLTPLLRPDADRVADLIRSGSALREDLQDSWQVAEEAEWHDRVDA